MVRPLILVASLVVTFSIVVCGHAIAHGFPDQVNDPTTFSGFDSSCPPEERVRLYQSFTPTRRVLSGIDLRVLAFTHFAGLEVRIQVLEGSLDGPVLGEDVAVVPSVPQTQFTTALIHFDFSPPLITRPGSEYFIAWMGRRPSFWIGSPADTYSGGRVYTCTGAPWTPSIDMNFITYGEPAADSAAVRRPRIGAPSTPSGTTGVIQQSGRYSWGALKVTYR